MTSFIGWVSSAVLVATISTQVTHQWKRRTSRGVSPWLFVGQWAASSGLLVYSLLRSDYVFVFLNMVMAVAAIFGLAVWFHFHRRDRRGAGTVLAEPQPCFRQRSSSSSLPSSPRSSASVE